MRKHTDMFFAYFTVISYEFNPCGERSKDLYPRGNSRRHPVQLHFRGSYRWEAHSFAGSPRLLCELTRRKRERFHSGCSAGLCSLADRGAYSQLPAPPQFVATASAGTTSNDLGEKRLTPGEYKFPQQGNPRTGSSGVGGIQTVVLKGDPNKAGLYTIMLRVPAHKQIVAQLLVL
jgi:hypothetical protein